MDTPLQPNSIRIDYENNDEVRALFANLNEGDSVELKVQFTMKRKDTTGLDGNLDELCLYEGDQEQEVAASGVKPISISIVINTPSDSGASAGEPKTEEMAYVPP